jgi:hypothetical protein
MFDNIKPVIEKSLSELNDLLDVDKHKEFKLYESYELYNEYMKTVTKLKFLSGCGIHIVRQRYNSLNNDPQPPEYFNRNCMGYLLYMGVILSIITHYYTWGTDPVTARNMVGSL